MGPQENKKANKSLNILKVYLHEKHHQAWTWLWMPLPALLLMVKGRWTLKSVMHACMLSRFSHSRFFATLWTVTHQAPLSMGFSREEYWSGLSCSPPGDLPNPGIEAASPRLLHWQADSLPPSHQGSPTVSHTGIQISTLQLTSYMISGKQLLTWCFSFLISKWGWQLLHRSVINWIRSWICQMYGTESVT